MVTDGVKMKPDGRLERIGTAGTERLNRVNSVDSVDNFLGCCCMQLDDVECPSRTDGNHLNGPI